MGSSKIRDFPGGGGVGLAKPKFPPDSLIYGDGGGTVFAIPETTIIPDDIGASGYRHPDKTII